ncbi:putative LRR containing protein, partial [Trachipleistophora hominis]
VDSSQIHVDAVNTRSLKAITIINSTSIVYDPSIHLSLSYLSISMMNIGLNLDLVPGLDTFLLTDSILAPGIAIKVNENISYLSLCNSVGIIDMKGVAGLGIIEFKPKHALRLDRHTGGNDGGLLYIENYTFEHNIAVSNDIQTIHLKNVKAKKGVKLILAQGCKSLKLDSSWVAVDTSQATFLEKLTLKNMKLLISENLLVVPSTIKTLVLLNTVITGSCTLPIHIRTVVLREVKLANSSILKFNQECRKVRFYHCSGEYDLSGIQKLEVLGLVPELKGTLELKVCLPSLDNVRKLDIAYNLNEDCLESCLARYINLESLTVRSIDYREKCLPYPQLSLVKSDVFNPSNMNAWLIQKISEYELPREHLDNETANLLNIKMNIFFKRALYL